MIFVYVDWTLETTPRPFYVGIGNEGRIKCLIRNIKHTAVKNLYGIKREILAEFSDRKIASETEIFYIKQFIVLATLKQVIFILS